MDFDTNDNKNIIGVIVILCLIFIVIGLTFLLTSKKVKQSESTPTAIKKIDTEVAKQLTEQELNKLNDGFLRTLYSYSTTETDLITYLSNLNNNQKLYLGDIMKIKNNNTSLAFVNIKNNLINILGNDIGVKGEDYYIGENEQPFIKYNTTIGEFTLNEEYENGSGLLTDLSTKKIYNYKVKSIDKIENGGIITVYGMYKNHDGFQEYIENDKGIKRYIGVDDRLEEFGYPDTEEMYLTNLYQNDIQSFLEFKYTYTLNNNSYILTDFNVVS